MTDARSAGDDSVVTVLAAFGADGWSANHLLCAEGRLECGECAAVFPADTIKVAARHRVEGASDPDDMQIVVGFACPECGAKGAVVAGYGPTGSENDLEFMSSVDLSTGIDPMASGTDPMA